MPLKDQLFESRNYHHKLGYRNYWAAYVLAICSAGSSVAAGILITAGVPYKALTAILASVPAAVLAVNAVLKFDAHSAFHWKKSRLMGGLYRKLEYEGKTDAEISQQLSQVEAALETDWQPFGGLTAPTDASPRRDPQDGK